LPQNWPILKILVIRFSSIGDIVLCSPVLRWLKNNHPEAEIHFLTKPQFVDLVQPNPNVTAVWPLEGFSETAKKLKNEKFDLVVDLHKNLRSLRFRTALQAKTNVSFKKLSLAKYLSVKTKNGKNLPKIHLVERYKKELEKIGITTDDLGLEYYGAQEPKGFSDLPETYNVLVAGAAHATKKLPDSLIQKIVDASELPLVILGAPNDNKPIFDALECINLCGKSSLQGSAFVVQHAQSVYTSDTGLMHIAAAFKRNIHIFWGNTIPEFGMYPYQTSFTNHEVKGLSCRPCSKIGFASCPKGHFKCMEEQTI
jgi:ADP-heptose:LPS heptosyltransferase